MRAVNKVHRWRTEACACSEATGGGHVRQKLGVYDRAVGAGVTVVPLLVETSGGCAPPLMSALQRVADWRQNKLTSSEFGYRCLLFMQ